MIIGPLGFAAPWMLTALIALPVLWLILRAIPPAPIRRRFPAVALMLGLTDDDSVSDRTPWWLLLLRMLAVAALIVGLAGPVLNPEATLPGRGPLLIVSDASWASGADWSLRRRLIDDKLAEAGRMGRPVALVRLSAPEAPRFQSADVWRNRLGGLAPEPWDATPDMADRLIAQLGDGGFETFWISDGIARPSRAPTLAALQARGWVSVYESDGGVVALAPASFVDGAVRVSARRSTGDGARSLTVRAEGRDPAGNPAVLARVAVAFEDGADAASGEVTLPAELRGRITHFSIEGNRSAAGVALSDDSLRRREVALIAGREDREGLELLSPLHYLRQALAPTADLLSGALGDILPANPDVIVLADVAKLSPQEQGDLLAWTEAGGTLLRFAGPRLAASEVSRAEEDPLMPVRLRAGGRTVGGAMSWGAPKSLAAFDRQSPFFGLTIPDDVTVSAQVMAQPDPTLADRVIAQLSDGTPLVTRKPVELGQVVLFHVTANAEWSSLPLSGLFVEMMERLAVAGAGEATTADDLAGTVWQPERVLDGFGAIQDAGTLPGVDGAALIEAPLGPELRPGIYAGADRRIARNVLGADSTIAAASWPASVARFGLDRPRETPLTHLLLALALVLYTLDVLAALAVGGRLRGARGGTAAAIAAVALTLAGLGPQGAAQAQDSDDTFAITAASELALGHVLTGDARLDEVAAQGLMGLSEVLYYRTSVEPATPMAVDLETDELSLFPMLYWPISPDQPTPSDEAYARLNRYIRGGGLILFDTRDADIAGFGAASPNGRKLQQLAAPLAIPPLEPIPVDHVLTRTFYLLQDFPGRHASREIWVEAAPADAEQVEGMPFRNLNDGVTPVVIGGNDWAAAWATDNAGNPQFPVGRGYGGERQRELAYRFGVNLVMHVLTGNYKSDQVHVPALLDRLGQ